jgi:hypothetical protein
MEQLDQLIQWLMTNAPWFLQIIVVMGTARLIFKPLMVFLESVVQATPTEKDNLMLESAKASSAYRFISFVIDYVGSIKIPPKK